MLTYSSFLNPMASWVLHLFSGAMTLFILSSITKTQRWSKHTTSSMWYCCIFWNSSNKSLFSFDALSPLSATCDTVVWNHGFLTKLCWESSSIQMDQVLLWVLAPSFPAWCLPESTECYQSVVPRFQAPTSQAVPVSQANAISVKFWNCPMGMRPFLRSWNTKLLWEQRRDTMFLISSSYSF